MTFTTMMAAAPVGQARVLCLGAGMLGGRISRVLTQTGHEVHIVSRTGQSRRQNHHRADLATITGRATVIDLVNRMKPDRLILVHGPSDVSWFEEHEEEARNTHVEICRLLADTPCLLVSTDNVFDGDCGLRRDDERPDPSNAYGRVKFAAEQALCNSRGHREHMVLRVSLVYHEDGSGRADFVQTCLRRAHEGKPFKVPCDQFLTPVHVDDVAVVCAALIQAGSARYSGAKNRLRNLSTWHLAGPEELSREQIARRVYRSVGANPSLVVGVPRDQTRWACRPTYSSLQSSDFSHLPGLAAWRPRDIDAGLEQMKIQRLAMSKEAQ